MFVYRDGQHLWLKPPPILTGADIATVSVGFNSLAQEPTLNVRLTRRGAAVFAAFTASHIGRRAAIILDGEVVSAPVIQAAVEGGELEVTGTLGSSARRIAARIQQIADLAKASAHP